MTAAVSGLVLVACAAQRETVTPTRFPPMVVDNYRAPSTAELYAQRFQWPVAQVTVDATRRFVLCGEQCPGATPKTPVTTLNAAVLQRMRSSRRTEPPADPASQEARERPAESREVEPLGAVRAPSARARTDSADATSSDRIPHPAGPIVSQKERKP